MFCLLCLFCWLIAVLTGLIYIDGKHTKCSVYFVCFVGLLLFSLVESILMGNIPNVLFTLFVLLVYCSSHWLNLY